MDHDMSLQMNWCRRCGRPFEEIVNEHRRECDGLPGVVHQRFIKAVAEMDKVFGAVVDAVISDLTPTSGGR